MKNIYLHKWFPRFFYKKPDGGLNSGVTGYFLLEWKTVFSIGILHFRPGSREAYHSHAFNALTFWLRGKVTEQKFDGINSEFQASLCPKYTRRDNCHRVLVHTDTWALTFRGPWQDVWKEYRPHLVRLTHGRRELK